MPPPRILLIGKNGQVGWELQRTLAPLGTVAAVDYPELDLAKPDSIRSLVDRCDPNVIVNAAAYTAVDDAENQADSAMRVNGAAAGILAEAAKRRGCWLVHYSTDYVFDGTKGAPYVESDAPNPAGVYGRSKLTGDRAVEQVDGDYLLFRLCWVYSRRGRNFLRTILRLAREKDELAVVNDQIGSPTWARLVAEATTLALRHVLRASNREQYRGLYHLASTGVVSWHGFAEAIVESIEASKRCCRKVRPIRSEEYPSAVKRPAFSALCSDKFERTFGLRLPTWEEGLKLALD